MEIFNTMSGEKEIFRPEAGNTARIYTCGPTVYGYSHIGNMRTYIFMDLLRRALKLSGFSLLHVMNITDVGHLVSDEDEGEDKMIQSAKKEQKSPYEIAQYYTQIFFRDIERLNIQKPEIITKATDNIPEMIEMVEGLLEKGYAYETSDGIYFDIGRFSKYGKLSGLDFENQLAGARVGINEEKRHPADFALWKKAEPNHLMQWQSPWGMGFPGWHIECSAMSRKYLGDTFDIHTGGVDHIPVHHENEIAQTEAYTGAPMARYWMHGEFLLIDNGKMSKSLGTAYTLDDLEKKGFTSLDFRYFCLNANYRKKLNFTWEGLRAARTAYGRLLDTVIGHRNAGGMADLELIVRSRDEFYAAIEDDLNVPLALGIAWNLAKTENRSSQIYDLLIEMDEILGLSFLSADEKRGEPEVTVPAEVIMLASERDEARKRKDFKLADEIREKIRSMGYDIKDTREGAKTFKISEI